MPDKKITRKEIKEIYNKLRLTSKTLEYLTNIKTAIQIEIKEIQKILIDLEDIEE